MPIETMSSVRTNFAENFIHEVEEQFNHNRHHVQLAGERGYLNHGRGMPGALNHHGYAGDTVELSVVNNRGHHESPHHSMQNTEDQRTEDHGLNSREDRFDRGYGDHHQ